MAIRLNMTFISEIKSNVKPKRLAVKLSSRGEQYVLNGHPWIFSDSITKINSDARTGDLAIVFSKNKNKVMGIGLYDASSPIRIKMIHNSPTKVIINAEFFHQKIIAAHKKRFKLLQTKTSSYRLLFGENDGFPGLIADVYSNVLVVKLYSEIWLPYLEWILKSLREESQAKTIVMRLSRQLKNSKHHSYTDGQVVYGNLESEVVEFIEHGIHFSANVIKGHKTGYFLDHRENRRLVGSYSAQKSVLDVFAYAGGFSVHALANNAVEVTSVDISEQALELAKYNASLNNFKGRHITLCGDAFTILKELIHRNKSFDVVVIDPPSFAKEKKEIALAKKKYAQLAELGAQLTNQGGLLVLASCSSRISSRAFYDINVTVLNHTNRPYTVLNQTQHDIDHPINFPEGAYLKTGYYRFNDAF